MMMTSYVQILNAVKLAHYMKMVGPFSATAQQQSNGGICSKNRQTLFVRPMFLIKLFCSWMNSGSEIYISFTSVFIQMLPLSLLFLLLLFFSQTVFVQICYKDFVSDVFQFSIFLNNQPFSINTRLLRVQQQFIAIYRIEFN